MNTLTTLRASTHYEFRMQIRKPSLWIVLGVLFAFMLATAGPKFPLHLAADTPMSHVMANWALAINILAPIGVGTLLADRLMRDRRLGVEELLDAQPASKGARLWGKYCGTLMAAITPVVVAMLLAAVYESIGRGSLAAFWWTPAAFAAIIIPGLVFVAAFALIVPAFLSAPLFRVLFVGYWMWGNLTNPDLMPTLTGTILTPIGDYPAAGFFGIEPLWAGTPGIFTLLRPETNPGAAAISIAILIAAAAVALLGGQLLRKRQST